MSRQPDLFAIPRASAPSLMELRARRDALLREVLRSWPDDTGIETEDVEGEVLKGQAWQWLQRSAGPARLMERLLDNMNDLRRLQSEIRAQEAAALDQARRAMQR
jgi:hypothetical protein